MKKTIKKFAVWLAVMLLTIGLSACGRGSGDDSIDIDLTCMSATMVEAQVNDIINLNTSKYIDKTIKAQGPYIKNGTLNGIFIENALSCCAQGLVIVYSEEYPAVNTRIQVEGVLKQNTQYGVHIDVTSFAII